MAGPTDSRRGHCRTCGFVLDPRSPWTRRPSMIASSDAPSSATAAKRVPPPSGPETGDVLRPNCMPSCQPADSAGAEGLRWKGERTGTGSPVLRLEMTLTSPKSRAVTSIPAAPDAIDSFGRERVRVDDEIRTEGLT